MLQSWLMSWHNKILNRFKKSYQKNQARFVIRAVIVLIALVILVFKRSIWTPDTLLLLVVVIGAVFGKYREVIIRFVPFLGLLIVYDSMRGIADDLAGVVNYIQMIQFDRWLFNGQLPTVYLQSLWWDGHVGVLEFYLYFLYTLHFLVPLIVGIVLWKFRPALYWPFVLVVIGTSFAAFIIYILFPAAPPWMAKEAGIIGEPLHRISSDVWWAMGVENFSELYKQISPNAVAAVPSLHSAYPVIAWLFMIAAFGWRPTWWMGIYPLSMWVGIIYLGEHYVFDILAALIVIVFVIFSVWLGYRILSKYNNGSARSIKSIEH